jgi:maleylacetoacetate isomerase
VKPYRLYHYWRSSCSWRVRWALEIKKLPVEYVHVNLLDDETDRPEHRARNPMGTLPVLETPWGALLTESLPILEWLEERYPSGVSLLPQNSDDRFHVRRLAELVNSGIQPIQNLTVLDRISFDPQIRKEWSQHFIRQGFVAYESLCASRSGRFSLGETLTLADLFLVPQVYNAIRFELDLSSFPVIERIWKNGLATPECLRAHPDRFAPQG